MRPSFVHLRPKTLAIVLPVLAVLIGTGVVAWVGSVSLSQGHFTPGALPAVSAPPPSALAPAPQLDMETLSAVLPDLIEPRVDVRTGALRRGETLAASLASLGVSREIVHTITVELSELFNFRYARPGDSYRLVQDPDGRLLEFEYSRSDFEIYQLRLAHGAIVAELLEVKLERRPARIAGIVSSSLYDSIKSLGERPELAGDFADIFAWDVDFSRTVQPGDEFQLLYERLYRGTGEDEEYVRPGRILAAYYSGHGGEHVAVYFEAKAGVGGYYRPDGSSVRRQFLRAPLKYRRISSHYSLARRHPILNVVRPHQGIDYAARPGTPVWSVSDGVVIHKGWDRGFGRMIKVRHGNGYVSMYGHLSRYASGLKVGKTVQQQQVIGYVGSSGLSTGPHLDFRMKRYGRLVNPASIRSPAGKPIPEQALDRFHSTRDQLLTELGAPLVLTQEAM